MACSSSLVALNTAWSGYQGFGFDAVVAAGGLAVEPVVVLEAGRVPAGAAALLMATGSSTNLILSNGTATSRAPTPRKPPTLMTAALTLPLLSINRSLIEPTFSFLSL